MAPSLLSQRYELGRVLGRGGMAEVREAQDVVLGRRVAVKILNPALAEDPSFVERFRREATSVAAINHPNLVGIFDAGIDGETRYLVMEYVEGRTLAEVLRDEGRLDVARVLAIGAAAAGALEAVHQAGLVHRDVKPGNIMVSSDGEVKLMDLGIARLADATALTATSTVLGTAAYLSPEQAQGQLADARSDVYSLGCVLYEAATGRRPFEGDSSVALAMQHVNAVAPAPSGVVDELPGDFDAVIAVALAKDPAERYATAADLADDLERLRAGVPVVVSAGAAAATTVAMGTAATAPMAAAATAVHPGPPPAAAPAPMRRRRPVWLVPLLLLVGLGLALALAAGLGVFDSGGDGESGSPGGNVTEMPASPPPTEETTTTEPPTTTEAPTTTEPPTTTTEAPEPATGFAALDEAVAAVVAEADQALADGEIDQSARDGIADDAADAAEEARDGDDDALDDVESLREELDDLREDGDLTAPTYNALRRAVDDLEDAIVAVL